MKSKENAKMIVFTILTRSPENGKNKFDQLRVEW